MKFDIEEIRTAILSTGLPLRKISQAAGVSSVCLRRAVQGKNLQYLTALKLAKVLKIDLIEERENYERA